MREPEVVLSGDAVRALVAAQHPDLPAASLTPAGEGWDFLLYRVGDGLALRLPRVASAVDMLLNEQRWLPHLAEHLPTRLPIHVRTGTPTSGYPWPWAVVRWIDGRTADASPLNEDGARQLAAVLTALHALPEHQAPSNPWRQGTLASRDEVTSARLGHLALADDARVGRLAEVWRDALTTPQPERQRWIHGDVHARNVIVRDGALEGIIDWGDTTWGDVSTDLACAWLSIATSASRRVFLDRYGPSPEEVRRARGWALYVALVMVESGDPAHEHLGHAALDRLLLPEQ